MGLELRIFGVERNRSTKQLSVRVSLFYLSAFSLCVCVCRQQMAACTLAYRSLFERLFVRLNSRLYVVGMYVQLVVNVCNKWMYIRLR